MDKEARARRLLAEPPVDDALAAIAAAANLHLLQRDGTFILNACAPPLKLGTRYED